MTEDELIAERRKVLAGAEMAALCALAARRGLRSPYGGEGYPDGPDERHAEAFENGAVLLLEKSEALWQQVEDLRAAALEREVG